MRVTIISDASFCPNTKAAGYGGWVVCDRGNNASGGPLNGAPTSGAAETMAICNVVWEGFKANLIQCGDHLTIQTDCATAIKVYKEARWTSAVEGSAFKWLNDQARKYNLTIEFRHVKGHSNVQDTRSKAQRFCDERARSAMQKERSKIRLQECKKLIKDAKQKDQPSRKGQGHLRRNTRLNEKARLAARAEDDKAVEERDERISKLKFGHSFMDRGANGL